eukprot:CAMPEP_0114352902 /NCGR_PEP_ID=MMETSP0101-20121206/18278_1 /TAXON_ID=38822 ORGANISM="Pteridomonas danica, Strain PT" /NCGR_SAMPLE_ID=MMETSP0101 /ASSEMBLY_ACC=CAM_ASM_000211 /LENGTH=165 /DNA_ID=CAMNT_0001493503 /DNA_START=315 /DNA_END=810 /DNA_ORIENTATION=-
MTQSQDQAGQAAAEEEVMTSPEALMICDMGFPLDHAALALSRCGHNVDQAVEFLFAHNMHLDRMVAEEAQKKGQEALVASSINMNLSPQHSSSQPKTLKPIDDFISFLRVSVVLLNSVNSSTSTSTPSKVDQIRSLPEPSVSANNRADMLIAIKDEKKNNETSTS